MRRNTILRLTIALALIVLALLFTRAPRALGARIAWVGSLQHAVSTASIGTTAWLDGVWRSFRAPGRTVALEAEVAELRAAHAALERELLETRDQQQEQGTVYPNRFGAPIGARVVAAMFVPAAQALTVAFDSGSEPAVGQPAAAHGALIGIIAASGTARATIQLLGDPRTRIGVELATTSGVLGVLEADPGGGVVVTHIPSDQTITVGAAVVTGATNEHIPRGVPIGTITEVRRDADGFFQTAVVSPIVNPHRLTTVTIFEGVKSAE